MKFRTLVLSLSALAGLAAVASLTPAGAQTKPAGGEATEYQVDPVHSTVIFGIEHLGVGYFYGRINAPFGEFHFDPDDPSSCSFEVKAKTDNVDTGNDKRDGHLKSGDFFNAREFPEITFRSTRVESAGDKKYKVTGDLTMHGVTRPISIELVLIGAKDVGQSMGGFRAGFRTTFTVKRSDWGITYMPGGLGEEVTMMVGIEGVRKK